MPQRGSDLPDHPARALRSAEAGAEPRTEPDLPWTLSVLTRAAVDVDHELARRLGLRALDYTAFSHVLTAGEPLGPADLSARLGISTGSASELADRLERAGFVRRRSYPYDRRRVVLRATDAGTRRVLHELGPLIAAVGQLGSELDCEERRTVERYLSAVSERMRQFATGRDPRGERPEAGQRGEAGGLAGDPAGGQAADLAGDPDGGHQPDA